MSALPPKAHSVRSRMSAKCQKRTRTGSPILAIGFNRVGGVLIPRTASKLISRRNGRSLRRLAHALRRLTSELVEFLEFVSTVGIYNQKIIRRSVKMALNIRPRFGPQQNWFRIHLASGPTNGAPRRLVPLVNAKCSSARAGAKAIR
jgi:hypothetical protein